MNVNNNNIDEILDLAVLNKLTHLYAADNQLEDIQVKLHFIFYSYFLLPKPTQQNLFIN